MLRIRSNRLGLLPPPMVGQTCRFAPISPPASAAMLAEPWGYARQIIAPLILVKVWAAQQPYLDGGVKLHPHARARLGRPAGRPYHFPVPPHVALTTKKLARCWCKAAALPVSRPPSTWPTAASRSISSSATAPSAA